MTKIIGTIGNYNVILSSILEEDTAYELDLELGTYVLDFVNQ